MTKNSDYIIINHGANDRGGSLENYLLNYEELLNVIIKMNPKSKIIALSAFCGAFHKELGDFIDEYNKRNGTSIAFIDSDSWVPVEPLHPDRNGHRIIAEALTKRLAALQN